LQSDLGLVCKSSFVKATNNILPRQTKIYAIYSDPGNLYHLPPTPPPRLVSTGHEQIY